MGRNLFPDNRPAQPSKLPKTSVRVSDQEKKDLSALAEVLNAIEQLRESRAPDWAMTTLMEHFIREGIEDAWKQLGGRQETDEARDDYVARAKANLERHKKKRR